jgi:hypothetical protein
MNERSQKRASGMSMRSECECDRAECSISFPMTIDAYEAVRASGRRFVVAPGHQHRDESILRTARLYLVIEKLGSRARHAEALNPR